MYIAPENVPNFLMSYSDPMMAMSIIFGGFFSFFLVGVRCFVSHCNVAISCGHIHTDTLTNTFGTRKLQHRRGRFTVPKPCIV